jgi:hypothetical protein
VSSRKPRRRASGHPAKVAARRERSSRPRRAGAGTPQRSARQICREAAALDGALEAELWASALLGVLWRQRFVLPSEEASGDQALALGGPLIDAIARAGGPGAAIALAVIQHVDDGELGMRAGELVRELPDAMPRPAWLAGLGEVEVERAAVMRERVFDDGFTVFIEARHPDGERHAVGVYVDNNLGGIAKDILLADAIERVEQVMQANPDPDGELRLEPIEPSAAAGHVHAAIELTDMTLEPPVGEDFASLRAFALMRADETPGLRPAPDPPDVSPEERDRLRDEFLSSPEGAAFEPDGDEAYTASLAIDFCAGYVDGRPLRWSPVVVELFMADWIPRKVMADGELLERVPAALDAWVRFAGRARGTPDWAIERTRAAIPRWRHEMARRASDPGAGGPAKQFLAAAREAGIDLTDEDALGAFVARWNEEGEPA